MATVSCISCGSKSNVEWKEACKNGCPVCGEKNRLEIYEEKEVYKET